MGKFIDMIANSILPIKTSSTDDVLNFFEPGDKQYTSADVALQNSDIYSLIMQLSGDLASVRYRSTSPQVNSFLQNPSKTANGHAFWQSMFAQLLLGGECFAYRWRNLNGVELRWEYLRPSQVSTFIEADGSGLLYKATFDEPDVGFMDNIPQSDMIHIRLLSQNGGMTGISPLTALANELKIKDKSNDLTLHSLTQSIIAPGVLSVTGGGLLKAKDKASRSNQFYKQMQQSQGPIVLDDLEKYTPLEIKGDVSKLLEQVNWTGTQIAKVYGVPDSYINGTGDQQSSIDMIAAQYGRALKRYTNAIVSELNDKLASSISADIRPAIDPVGDDYANQLADLVQSGLMSEQTAQSLLDSEGYFDNLKGGD